MSNEINLRTARNNDTLLGLISEKLTEENGGKKVNVNWVWNHIKNIQIESINTGAARFDRKRHVLLFNINDKNVPNKNELVKIIIHELTHATKGHPEGKNSQKEERMCETRAIKSALKLIQAGVIDDFQIPSNPPIYISSLSTDKQIDEYVSDWLVMCRYTSLPEEIK